MRNISIVIPSYNGAKLLSVNLPKLNKLFPQVETIVVDDGSVDKTQCVLSNLKSQISNLKIVKNKNNLGFSSAVNKGIRAAKSPLVLLLNNDCLPKSNFLSHILPYFKDPKTFAVSCLEITESFVRGRPACSPRSEAGRRGRGIGGFKKGLLFHKPGSLDKNNTLWAFGACTVYNKEIFMKLGGFDENFNPFYWEDFDLSYRALKSGYKIYFEKKAVVYHQESATIKKIYSEKEIQQISFRNQLFTCWKNITDTNLLLKHLIWLPYYLIITSWTTNGSFLLGFFMAIIKIKDILKHRSFNKFTFTDKEVLEPFQKELL